MRGFLRSLAALMALTDAPAYRHHNNGHFKPRGRKTFKANKRKAAKLHAKRRSS
jgi:hypothetical protein